MRRIVVTYERVERIVLDEQRVQTLCGTQDPTAIARRIEREVTSGELSVAEVGPYLSTENPEPPELDLMADVEEQCERHPDVWVPLTNTNKKLTRCFKCEAERREPKGKR